MKKLLLSLILMVFAAQLSAQSLAFKYEGETAEPGTTIDIVADLNPSMEMQFDIHVINTTDADINVVAQMEDLTGTGMTYLCWGNCFMPGVLEAQNTVTASGEGVFNGHVMFVDANSGEVLPVGTEIKMAYTFFDERNPEQTFSFNVNFKYQKEETSALTFKYEGKTAEPGTTIDIVSDLNPSMEIQFDIHVINTTDADINVVAQMEDLTGIGMTYLCWGNCFMPGVLEAQNTVTAGGEGVFNGHVMFIDANSGEVLPVGTEIKMAYTFFDERNPEEKYVFTVNFKYQTEESIVDYNSVEVFSNAYPNPANNTVSFDYNMPYDANSASVAIYNMMGQEVVRQDLNLGGSRADINVSDLNEGVYFYSLIVNNQTVKTNKFVVSR